MLLLCPVSSIEQTKQKSQQANQNEKSNESTSILHVNRIDGVEKTILDHLTKTTEC